MTPLEERAALFAELATVQENADRATGAQAQAAHALADVDRRSGELHQDRARGRIDDDVLAAFEQERSQARLKVRTADEAAVGALDARRAIEQELQELFAGHLDVFTAEAEQATQRAAVALDALRAPYAEAWAAWSVAKAKWRPLLPALVQEIERDFTGRGEYPDPRRFAQLATVPEVPLPTESAVFGTGREARPIGMTPDGAVVTPRTW